MRQHVHSRLVVYGSDEQRTLQAVWLPGIARATQVSEPWLQKYVNDKYAQVPRQVEVSAKSKGKLTIECDEVGAKDLVSS